MRAAIVACSSLLVACSSVDFAGDLRALTPADVRGVYHFCTLRFTPYQTALPVANLLTSVIDATPAPPALPAALTLSGTDSTFDMSYTRRGSGALRVVHGDMEYGQHSVFLYLTSQTPTIIQQEALLPTAHLDLVFDKATGRLTAGDEVSSYFVRLSDYASAAGISEEGLQDRIQGHVTAVFSSGSC